MIEVVHKDRFLFQFVHETLSHRKRMLEKSFAINKKMRIKCITLIATSSPLQVARNTLPDPP